jgi:hypothetical protein
MEQVIETKINLENQEENLDKTIICPSCNKQQDKIIKVLICEAKNSKWYKCSKTQNCPLFQIKNN